MKTIKIVAFMVMCIGTSMGSAFMQINKVMVNPTYYVMYGGLTGMVLTLLLMSIIIKPVKHDKKIAIPYTLVEILMVIVIMSMLMMIAMPGFIDMVKGSGVDGTTRNITQTLKLSRSYAINNRECIAVLMPQSKKTASGTAYPNDSRLSKYYDRSYRVCIVDENKKFKRWIDGEEWEFTHKGIAILEVDSDNAVGNVAHTFIPHNNDKITVVDNVDMSDIGIVSRVNNVAAVIFKPSGQGLFTKQPYIEIGEAVYNNNLLIITNTNPQSYKSITVGKITGRVEVIK